MTNILETVPMIFVATVTCADVKIEKKLVDGRDTLLRQTASWVKLSLTIWLMQVRKKTDRTGKRKNSQEVYK